MVPHAVYFHKSYFPTCSILYCYEHDMRRSCDQSNPYQRYYVFYLFSVQLPKSDAGVAGGALLGGGSVSSRKSSLLPRQKTNCLWRVRTDEYFVRNWV